MVSFAAFSEVGPRQAIGFVEYRGPVFALSGLLLGLECFGLRALGYWVGLGKAKRETVCLVVMQPHSEDSVQLAAVLDAQQLHSTRFRLESGSFNPELQIVIRSAPNPWPWKVLDAHGAKIARTAVSSGFWVQSFGGGLGFRGLRLLSESLIWSILSLRGF